MMAASFVLSIVGLISGLLGTLMLAFSLNRAIEELVLAFKFTDTTLEALVCDSRQVPRFTRVEKRLELGLMSAKWKTNTGLILLAISFALQFLALFFQMDKA